MSTVRSVLVLVCVLSAALIGPCVSQRLYIRHKRSLERESSVPPKESTVVVQTANDTDTAASGSPTADLPKDFENEIASSEKDCRDFLEFDYNPLNDSMFFNGRIPGLFHGPALGGHGNTRNTLNSFEEMFHRMLQQASQMFHRFPAQMPSFNNNYPDNYNGTEEEIVTIGGQQFRKKQQIINKSVGGSKISIMSTVYEPVHQETVNTNTTVSAATNGTNTPNDLTDGKIISYK